jgi:hypothetical protein
MELCRGSILKRMRHVHRGTIQTDRCFLGLERLPKFSRQDTNPGKATRQLRDDLIDTKRTSHALPPHDWPLRYSARPLH